MERANRFVAQLGGVQSSNKGAISPNTVSGRVGVKSDDDVVIVSALRTAITKAGRGAFANTYVEDMLTPVLKAVIDQSGVDPSLIGDVVCGSVLGLNNQRANEIRIASLMAGIPDSVPVHLVNRQCSSGLQAVAHCAASIKAGFYDIGLAAGVESMSGFKHVGDSWKGPVNPKIFMDQQAKDCLLPMGITSENVARTKGVTRQEQDEMSVNSHARASRAIREGRFKNEIVPITVTHKGKSKVIDTDEGVREGTSMKTLGKLKPAFQKGGTTTAGNSSQVSDGAAAVLVCKRSKAKELGLPIIGKFMSFSVAGVPPNVMGIGPAVAIPMALEQAGVTKEDIDVYEINEAFASQAVYSVKHLGLPWKKVNVNGGAVALGHPLGCTGARMVATLLNELKRSQGKLGVISMCIGSGMGAAAVFENE
jgi:acetyl-CoA acyltransferase 1